MICLALDTTLDACSVAVVEGGTVHATLSEPMQRGHQERLAPLVAEAMAAAGLGFGALDRVATTVGPGSFTGLRVGLGFSKALALALDIPCVGVSALEALAASVEAAPFALVVAAIDARRGQVYIQAFRGGGVVTGPEILGYETATARMRALGADRATPVAGSGASCMTGIGSGVPARETVDPVALARLAMGRTPADARPAPLYLRPPDARTLAERAPAVVETPAGLSAAETLAALHARAYDRPWRAEDIEAILRDAGGMALQIGVEPAGFILLRLVHGEAEILAVAVERTARRTGIGRALVNAALGRARAAGGRTVWLEVAEDNAAARALYSALDFTETGRRRGYYPRPGGAVDALVLQRPLNTP